MGTLGSGNHYLEVQEVTAISDDPVASAFGLGPGAIVVSVHCGWRGLGHEIGTEFLREMALPAPAHGIALPDRELARAPICSEIGERYLGAMRVSAAPGARFASSCHGAGRRVSRRQALKRWRCCQVAGALRGRGIINNRPSMRGIAEEAPFSYKHSTAVVEAAHLAGLSPKVATLEPVIFIKG
jgi:RNA-splicing ligase RtcB